MALMDLQAPKGRKVIPVLKVKEEFRVLWASRVIRVSRVKQVLRVKRENRE
jgi:hypothetical protein